MVEKAILAYLRADNTGSTIDYEGPEALARELQQAYEEKGELIRVLGLTQK
jgi:hypothetical protein